MTCSTRMPRDADEVEERTTACCSPAMRSGSAQTSSAYGHHLGQTAVGRRLGRDQRRARSDRGRASGTSRSCPCRSRRSRPTGRGRGPGSARRAGGAHPAADGSDGHVAEREDRAAASSGASSATSLGELREDRGGLLAALVETVSARAPSRAPCSASAGRASRSSRCAARPRRPRSRLARAGDEGPRTCSGSSRTAARAAPRPAGPSGRAERRAAAPGAARRARSPVPATCSSTWVQEHGVEAPVVHRQASAGASMSDRRQLLVERVLPVRRHVLVVVEQLAVGRVTGADVDDPRPRRQLAGGPAHEVEDRPALEGRLADEGAKSFGDPERAGAEVRHGRRF